jgi:hypothetical protein
MFYFDVAMHNISAVKVLDSFYCLPEEQCSFWFSEYLLYVLMEKEVSFFCVFEDHVDALIFADRVPKGDAVRVSQL